MTAPAASRAQAAASRGFLATAAAAVESFFVASAEPGTAAEGAHPVELRPVVCVFGLARGCGVTVIARALGAELAARDPGGAAVVCADARPAGIPLATRAATLLARALEDVPHAAPRAVGRLCLAGGRGRTGADADSPDRPRGADADSGARVADPERLVQTARFHAPVVIDAGSAALGDGPAALADRVVVVTTRDVEPALARVASECVTRVGPCPAVVLNRAPHDQPGLFALPNSPLGARLALGGREARGELGRAIAELADLLEEDR